MTAQVLDGRALARRLNGALKKEVIALGHPKPGLAVILVSGDPASEVYVRMKGRVANRIGFHHVQITLPSETTTEELLSEIDKLNKDDSVHGILVQLPLPAHINPYLVTEYVSPLKDVDGLTHRNIGSLASGRPAFAPCTPAGIMEMLKSEEVELEGKHAVVVGRSNLVGRPIARMLEQANCTVTMCHSRTRGLKAYVGQAEILVVAVGRPNFIDGTWIRPGSVVIDVGVNRLEDGSLCGDVQYEVAKERASLITPVPGGVGPMTIAMLMKNTWLSRTQAFNS